EPRPWTPSPISLVFFVERRVEGDRAAGEVELAQEGARLGDAVLAIHADVLPLHRERAGVADVVERDDDLLEIDVTAANRAEIPEAAGVTEAGVAAEHADGAVTVAPPHV